MAIEGSSEIWISKSDRYPVTGPLAEAMLFFEYIHSNLQEYLAALVRFTVGKASLVDAYKASGKNYSTSPLLSFRPRDKCAFAKETRVSMCSLDHNVKGRSRLGPGGTGIHL